jgi:hypothetical protein
MMFLSPIFELTKEKDAKISVKKPFSEFETDFSQIQKLQAIRRKLHMAISILDGILDVLSNLTAHAKQVSELHALLLPDCSTLCTELEQLSIEMKSHKATVKSLLSISDDLRFMVCQATPVLPQRSMLNLRLLTSPI